MWGWWNDVSIDVWTASKNFILNFPSRVTYQFKELFLYPFLDMLSLPDQFLDWLTGTNPDERLFLATMSPIPADDFLAMLIAFPGKVSIRLTSKLENVEIRSYGGPGGGHHVSAKSAFENTTNYNKNIALAIPNSELKRLNINHDIVSCFQHSLYREALI